MAKGFTSRGGELVHFRVHPSFKAEMNWAAKQLGCAAADIYREACERWLIEFKHAQAESQAE